MYPPEVWRRDVSLKSLLAFEAEVVAESGGHLAVDFPVTIPINGRFGRNGSNWGYVKPAPPTLARGSIFFTGFLFGPAFCLAPSCFFEKSMENLSMVLVELKKRLSESEEGKGVGYVLAWVNWAKLFAASKSTPWKPKARLEILQPFKKNRIPIWAYREQVFNCHFPWV